MFAGYQLAKVLKCDILKEGKTTTNTFSKNFGNYCFEKVHYSRQTTLHIQDTINVTEGSDFEWRIV